MFREHVAYGAVISMIVCVGVYSYALVTDPILLIFLFGVTVIGSFLPDVDSDSGIPFYLVFGTATLAATGVVLLYTLNSPYADDWRYLLGFPAGALFFFWLVVGWIVKKCTKHRGIFHSLPALLIASAATFLAARHYGLSDTVGIVFAAAMGFGFLSHLVLDELHSDITLDGIPFNTKHSAGTAMKWFSKRHGVNLAAYLILATLLYAAWQPRAEAFYNDSDVIEIGDSAPPEPKDNPGAGESSGGSGGAAEEGGSAGSETGGSTPGSGAGSSSGGSASGGGSSGGTSGLGSGGGVGAEASGNSDADASGDDTSGITTPEALLDYLAGKGGISGSGASSGAAGGASGGAGGTITIDAPKLREVLRGKYSLQDLLASWKTANGARSVGIIAASTAVRDRNIDAISFTGGTFEITYRSRGYLFSIIPISFPVRVEVAAEATSDRVRVRLPWYRFFVREFFTSRTLAVEINEVIDSEIKVNAEEGADLQLKLFEVIAEFLRRKIGTIADTVNLGAPASGN